MKKIIASMLAIIMVAMMCISVSAKSYYEYDNKMTTLKMELTSALYLNTSSNNEYVDVKGITRVDTGSAPTYTSFTMYSQVSYSYFVSSTQTTKVTGTPVSQVVNNASANSGYYIPQHGFTNACTLASFAFGFHKGWATSGATTILNAPETRGSSASQYSSSEIAEIRNLMS